MLLQQTEVNVYQIDGCPVPVYQDEGELNRLGVKSEIMENGKNSSGKIIQNSGWASALCGRNRICEQECRH